MPVDPPRIVVYSKPQGPGLPYCAGCRATTRWLDEHDVDREERDATSQSALSYIRDELGHREAPVVIVYGKNDQILADWGGFQPGKLEEWAA